MPRFAPAALAQLAVYALLAVWPALSAAEEPSLASEIDRLVAERLPHWQLKAASGRTSDDEFLRRVTLDLTGVVPAADEVRKFVADEAADKRAALVERLLNSPEHAAHMAVVYDVTWMERRPDKYVPTPEWQAYLAESIRTNKPLDVLVREILDSDGADPALRPAAKFILDREVSHDLIVRDIGRLFLGIDLQCAQCHDHPTVNDYKHEHYYGLQAFIAGAKLFRQEDGKTVLQENVVRELSFASVFEPNNARKTGPKLLGAAAVDMPEMKPGEEYMEKPSAKVRAVPKFSLRHALAETLPRAETREFARNTANRLWALLMGRGLVHPLDMHHQANPPSHPELLELLTDRLIAVKFDQRQFVREVISSQTYQRSSLVDESLAGREIPVESYAVANFKALSPEQLFASAVRATGNEKTVEQSIDAAIAARPESEREKLAADETLRAKARADERQKQIAEFSELFGGVDGTPEPEFQPSLTQALFLANSSAIKTWLTPQNENLVARLVAISDVDALAHEMYLSLLSRTPDAEELKLVREHLTRERDRVQLVQELVWSLLASAEFRLNH